MGKILKKNKGLFITFEGPEGSGKSTQMALLGRFLHENHIPYLLTREPGGSSLSTHLRRWILNRLEYKLAPTTELLLFLADRAQHVSEVIQPALQKGKVVLCDRYTDSTLAYQGGGRGFDLNILKSLNGVATSGLKPDLTLLLDVPVELGLKRALGRGKGKDRMEREKLRFHQNVRQTFLRLARADKRRFIVLDGRKDKRVLQLEVISELNERLPGGSQLRRSLKAKR